MDAQLVSNSKKKTFHFVADYQPEPQPLCTRGDASRGQTRKLRRLLPYHIAEMTAATKLLGVSHALTFSGKHCRIWQFLVVDLRIFTPERFFSIISIVMP